MCCFNRECCTTGCTARGPSIERRPTQSRPQYHQNHISPTTPRPTTNPKKSGIMRKRPNQTILPPSFSPYNLVDLSTKHRYTHTNRKNTHGREPEGESKEKVENRTKKERLERLAAHRLASRRRPNSWNSFHITRHESQRRRESQRGREREKGNVRLTKKKKKTLPGLEFSPCPLHQSLLRHRRPLKRG